MSYITGVLTAAGKDVVNFLVRGCGAQMPQTLTGLQDPSLTEFDTVILDFCSSVEYMGTGENGLPVAAKKSPKDGKYQIKGDHQMAPRQVFSNVPKDCAPVLGAVAAAAVVLIAPMPSVGTLGML